MIARWLFAPVDARTVALFRVVLALVLAWDLFRLRGALLPWLGPAHVAALVAALLAFGAGFRPLVSGLILAALLYPVKIRESVHVLMVAVAATALACRDPRAGDAHDAAPIWPIRLVQLQLSALYLVNALAKTTPHYLDGSVLAGFAATLPNFVATVDGGTLRFGPFALPLAVAAVASVVSEYVLAFGFWFRPLRGLTAVFGVLFHLVLKLVIRIGMLDWVSMTLYLAFLLPFERGARRTPR